MKSVAAIVLLALLASCTQTQKDIQRQTPVTKSATVTQRIKKVSVARPTPTPIDTTLSIVDTTLAGVTLKWTASQGTDVTGYRIYYGTTSQGYNQQADAGNNTTITIPNLTFGTLYFFSAKAYNAVTMTSVFSNEVSYRPSAPTPTPTPTPTASPTPSPTPTTPPSPTPPRTPTPSPTPAWIEFSGQVVSCNKLAPMHGVTILISGDITVAIETDMNGEFSITVPPGTNFVVTPFKESVPLASQMINTIDILTVMNAFLTGSDLPCNAAGDVNGDGAVNTMDMVGIQRFSLGYSTGIAFTGQYRFARESDTLNFLGALIGDVK